jgi:hypothetical protein
MLVAELHGHTSHDLADDEDFLTSTVFGHLRYVRPATFWECLFSKALSPARDGRETSLREFLEKRGVKIASFATLDVHFWPKHDVFGVPDLLLYFWGANSAPVVIVCEAKLWSDKSGMGADDQLLRYLRSLQSLHSFKPRLPRECLRSAATAVLYITPRESLREILDTVAQCSDEPHLADSLFRVQWQDVVEAADQNRPSAADHSTRLILGDVAEFLRGRNLEYFNGFGPCAFSFPSAGDGNFYHSEQQFVGFAISEAMNIIFDGRFYTSVSGAGFEGFKRTGLAVFGKSAGRFYTKDERC